MKNLTGSILAMTFVMLAGCASAPAPVPEELDFTRFGQGITVDEVRLEPAVAKDLPPAERAVLASRLRISLVSALSESTTVTTAGPGVLRLEVTVTEIDTANPTANGFSTALVAVPVDRGGIAFEARFYDASGGQPVATTTQRHKGSMFDIKGNFSHYGHAIHALGKWGEMLGQSMRKS